MISVRRLLSRAGLTTLVVAPLGLMGFLTVNVLLPTLKNPESKFYSSAIGYPAIARMTGEPIKVQTVLVESRSLEDSVAAPGESVALQQVDVRPQVAGKVEKVYVVEGQWVHRGEPLLQIERQSFENQVNTIRNNIANNENKLQALSSTAPQQLQQLKSNLITAKNKLSVATAQITETNSLLEIEIKSNIEAAKIRLDIAERQLKEAKPYAEQGVISKFKLDELEDNYAKRKQELNDAMNGSITNKNQQFNNKTSYISSQKELSSAQTEVEIFQTTLDKDMADKRLEIENNRIALQNALRDLKNTMLYATTDGLVSQVNINSGEVADPRFATSLITLNQEIVFKAYVDQARLNAVTLGDRATVRLVAYPGRTYSGRVIRLNPTVETNAVKPGKVGIDRQYTYSVWVTVDDLQMPPGLQGYVQFDKGKRSLVIPESAVTHLSGGEGMVMVAEAGRAVVKQVRLGRIFDNQREVIEGLKAGEHVVLNPRALDPGDRLISK